MKAQRIFMLFKCVRDEWADRFDGSLIFPNQNLIAGLIFPGIATGRDSGEMAKGADKVGVVGETGQLTGLLYADTLLQKLTCLQDAAVNDVFHHGKTGGRFEDAAEVMLAEVELAGDLNMLDYDKLRKDMK